MKPAVKIFMLVCGLLVTSPVARPQAAAPLGADIKVEEQALSPAGHWLGVAVSPHGVHVAVLALKGSRNVVLLDGVEGPTFDQLLERGQAYAPPLSGELVIWAPTSGPITFSDDGAHCLYFGKVGNQYIAVVDGKEIARGAFGSILLNVSFSPHGDHVFYTESGNGAHNRLVMDGKPEPWSSQPPDVVFSADGKHYAYFGTQPDAAKSPWGVVDGRQVPYFGDNLQFTATGHLLSVLHANGLDTLTLDDKPVMRATRIDPVWVSSVGAQVAAVMLPKAGVPTMLTINGKPIPGTEGVNVRNVFFSPDGKRYAAHCRTTTFTEFMLIDGKKGQEYQSILPLTYDLVGETSRPTFTADSSKFVYTALHSGKWFVVVNDAESDGFDRLSPPVLGGSSRIAYGTSDGGKYDEVVDGKVLAPPRTRDARQFAFSPDGAHYAFVTSVGASNTALAVDGVDVPGVSVDDLIGHEKEFPAFLFSPDGKHIVYFGRDVRNNKTRGLWLDQQFVFPTDNNDMGRIYFTADGQHMVWTSTDPPTATNTVIVDGRPSVKFRKSALDEMLGAREMGANGVLTFLAIKDGALVRYRITPPPDTSIATLLSGAK